MIDYIILLIFIVSIYYTFKYKFIQLNCFKKTKEVFFKERSKTAYQTFIVSIGSVFGTGNLIGVTTALIVGGPGSLFWMVIFAVFSGVFSIMENTLAVKYRRVIEGENRGGASYYIADGLNYKKLGVIISLFLLLCNTVIFQPLQVNTVTNALNIGFNVNYEIVFISMALFSIFFIFKGTKAIVRFSELVVPFMSIGFLLITLFVIVINIDKLPSVMMLIIKDAFNINSILSGGLFVGLKRSLFSHEAGLGTMPTISAMSNEEKSINQGYVQTFAVFFDTVIMCFLTGIMILLLTNDLDNLNGYELIINIFKKIFSFNENIGKYIAIIFMLIFGLATIVTQYYIGESNLLFLSNKKNNNVKIMYKCLFIIGLFIGVYFSLNSIWKIIDYGMVAVGCINIYAIIKLEDDFKECLCKEKNNNN